MTIRNTLACLAAMLAFAATPADAQTAARPNAEGITPPRPLPAKGANLGAPLPKDLPSFTGTVGIVVLVGKDGLVKACTVRRSSGHRKIDALACAGMRYTRFEPARDRAGKPVESAYATGVNFDIRN